jgi:hypothetical protein
MVRGINFDVPGPSLLESSIVRYMTENKLTRFEILNQKHKFAIWVFYDGKKLEMMRPY